jgi:hypothetical protein
MSTDQPPARSRTAEHTRAAWMRSAAWALEASCARPEARHIWNSPSQVDQLAFSHLTRRRWGSPQTLREDSGTELARRSSSSGWCRFWLYAPKPASLPVSVLLGFVLFGGGLAVRCRPGATGARVAARGADRGGVHRAHDLLGRSLEQTSAIDLQPHLCRRCDDGEHPAARVGVGLEGRRRGSGGDPDDPEALRLASRPPRPRR